MDPQHQHGAIGPIVGLIVILGIILAGGVYFYSKVQADKKYAESLVQPQNTTDTSPTETQVAQDLTGQISTQGTSTNPTDIQNDLDAFDIGDIDSIGNDI